MPLSVPEEDRELVDRDYASFTERVGALVTHYFDRVWNEGRVELTELMWNPAIVFHSPISPEPIVGRENLLEFVYAIRNAFSELHFEIHDSLADRDRVVLRVTQNGVHTGDYFGVPATGRRVAMPEIFIFRCGKGGPLGAMVEEIWLTLNALYLMQQMGVFPKGEPPPALFKAIVGAQRLGRAVRSRSARGGFASAAPGPTGIGYLPAFGRDPAVALLDLWRRYGDVVYCRRGPLRGYLIFHPDDVKYVLEDNVENYGHGAWVVSKVRASLGENVFTLDGDPWRARRRLLEPEFEQDRVVRFADTIAAGVDELLERWDTHEQRGEPVDIVREMELLSLANAGRAIFGADWERHAEIIGRARPLFVAQSGRELNSPLGLIPLSVPLPFHKRFLETREHYDAIVAQLIDARRRGEGDDLLTTLVRLRDTETGEGLSDLQVRDQATTVFFLWKPVAISLTWVWWLLGHAPEAVERLGEELARELDGGAPTPADLARLPYLGQVVDEALRLYPPGILQPREAVADDTIGGYAVPAGTRVVTSSYVTHRHTAFWDDPERFDPDRFAAGARVRHPYAFSPFGEPGPRRCLGYHLARLELQLVVASIAQRFRLTPLPGESVKTSMGVAMDFAKPIAVRLERASTLATSID